jgi:hypothetical protein
MPMASKLKIAAKLGFLLGGPVAMLTVIFGSGVHCGIQNQHGVLTFERDVLEMDVVVPDKDEDGEKDGEKKDGEKKDGEPKDDDEGKRADPKPTEDGGEKAAGDDGGTPSNKVDKEAQPPPPTPVEDPPPPTVVNTGTEFPVAVPQPLDDEGLASRVGTLRTVRVKVLVDRDLIAERSDWIVYASRLVNAASGSYKNLFGIELRLTGVVEWEAATTAMDRSSMVADLGSRPREGADLLIGLTARGTDADASAAVASGGANLGAGVVFADSRAKAPHLRGLLRELGHVFGAAPIVDAQSDAYQRGSFMTKAPVPAGATPWVDATSRRTILERKDHPFSEAG